MSTKKIPKRMHWVYFPVFVVFGSIFIISGMMILVVAFTPTPDINSFSARQVEQSTRIYDRTGQVLLFDYNRDVRRDIVPLSDISKNMVLAVVAMEDSSFYDHIGVRFKSTLRAAINSIISGSFTQGGSTITQQVVKNTLLTSEKSIVRKVHEWILAVRMEQAYSKDQIMEVYLNSIPLGGTIYGVETASQVYYRIPSSDLSIAQAAYLAAMIQAPSYFSPYGPNRDELDSRKNIVLSRMHMLGFINDSEYKTAKAENVTFATGARNSIIAPHFVFYILRHLEQKYGARSLVSGLRVITTLDAQLTMEIESLVKKYALKNEQKFNAENASLVAIDPSTGQILVMVGSRNFFDTEIEGQFNSALAYRQPGSTVKPFIYALALLNGYTRDTVIFDTPTQFSTSCAVYDLFNNDPPCYAPSNFDKKFRGPMTFETALAQSINIPAVKVLYLVGVRQAVNFTRTFGLYTLGDPNRYGLSFALGGGEVNLLDLTSAYSVFANGGVRNSPVGILKVVDYNGSVLESYTANPVKVIPEWLANDVSAMLSNAHARVPMFSLNSLLSVPGYDVAVKTGTTDDTRDAWVVGYTPTITLGIWVGNNDNTPMSRTTSGFIATPLWNESIKHALDKYPKRYFEEVSQIYSTLSPILRGNWAIPDENGIIVPRSLLYWTDKNNPRGERPQNPGIDPQFTRWEFGIQTWYRAYPELFH